MGLCGYCGQKTGWLQSSHAACIAKANSIGQIAQKLVVDEALAGRSYDELSVEVQKVLTDSAVSFKYVRDALLQGANDAASQIALKSPISKSACDRLVRIISGLDGTLGGPPSADYRAQMLPRRWFALIQLGMSYLLWQVLNNVPLIGIMPPAKLWLPLICGTEKSRSFKPESASCTPKNER